MSAVRPHTRLASEVNPFERSFSDNPKDSPSKADKNSSSNSNNEPKSAGPSTRAAAAPAPSAGSPSKAAAAAAAAAPAAATAGDSASTTSAATAAAAATTRRISERNRNNSSNSVIPAATTPSKGIAAEAPSTRPEYKPTLPPVASITSPSGDSVAPSSFPWGSSLAGSLRAGPLSPAMLAGPQNQGNSNHNHNGQGATNSSSGPNPSSSSMSNTNSSNNHNNHHSSIGFDPQSFRTGFTPDLSNFRTGLTPLAGGPTSFPPPSPNTAAFLAMVTNGTNGVAQPNNGPTITPNTLAALTGAANASQQGGANSHAHGSYGNNSHHNHNHHHGHHHHSEGNNASDFDIAFGRSFHGHDGTGKQQPSSRLRTSTRADDEASASVSPELVSMPLGPGGRNQSNQPNGDPVPGHGPNMAANGLFLLSQAHQMEMAKQDDPEAAAAAAALQGVSQIFTHPGQQPPASGAPGDPSWPGAIPGVPPGQQQQQQQQQPSTTGVDDLSGMNAAAPQQPNGKAAPAGGGKRAAKRKNSSANAKAGAANKKDAGGGSALPVAKRAKTSASTKGAGAAAAAGGADKPGHNRRTSAAASLTGGSEDNNNMNFDINSFRPGGEMDFGDFDDEDDDDDGGEDGEEEEDGMGGKKKKSRRPNKSGSHIDDDEKRKNFLERNRQAALKCRQRKKAWLASLQARVEYLTGDNEQLQTTVARQAQEIMYLKSALGKAQSVAVSHGIPATELQVPPINMNAMIHAHHQHHQQQQQQHMVMVSQGPMIPPGVPIPSAMHTNPHSAAPNPAAVAGLGSANVSPANSVRTLPVVTSTTQAMGGGGGAAGVYSAHSVPRPQQGQFGGGGGGGGGAPMQPPPPAPGAGAGGAGRSGSSEVGGGGGSRSATPGHLVGQAA